MWPLSAKQIYETVTNEACKNENFENIIIKGLCQDNRKLKSNQIFVAIKGDNFDGHDYLKQCFQNKLQLALVQKDSKILSELTTEEKNKCICVDDVTDSLRKLAQLMRNSFHFPVIGIGGSNGKTTTKELLYSMLLGGGSKVTKTEKSENGYLGMAITLLQEAHHVEHAPSVLVLEIGIDEIGAMQKHIEISKPDIVLLTALGPEHLTGLNNWETAAKEELILFSSPETTKIWQLADAKIKDYYFESLKNNKLNLCRNYVVIEKEEYENYLNESALYNPAKNKIEIIWNLAQENSLPLEVCIKINSSIALDSIANGYSLLLPGKHNAANFALSFAAALSTGKSPADIAEGFKKFTPPPMRSNLVTLPNGALLFNDSYNASPFSVEAALLILGQPSFIDKQKLVVLGDMLDLGSESNYWHESLVPALNKLKRTHLCLYGSAMYSCYKLLQEMKVNLFQENGSCVFWLDSQQDPGLFFEKITLPLSGTVILVKGSRGMKLERFVSVVEEKCKSS